jgi:hypothetical protein
VTVVSSVGTSNDGDTVGDRHGNDGLSGLLTDAGPGNKDQSLRA